MVQLAVAKDPGLRTKFVQATYRLEHPKGSGTGFIVSQPDPDDKETKHLLLVTAAHLLEQMDGDRVTLVLRERRPNGDWVAAPTVIQIRQTGKPLWHKHPTQDVAVIRLTEQKFAAAFSIPLQVLSTTEDWQDTTPEPGSLVRVVGFPHAAQFRPSEAGFPLTRLGCIASFPLTPYKQHATFLVDYNTFEGDSGGLVYSEEVGESAKIIGLVHGQHFFDERYKLIYQEGMIRKRLGLAIVVSSIAILEAIEKLP